MRLRRPPALSWNNETARARDRQSGQSSLPVAQGHQQSSVARSGRRRGSPRVLDNYRVPFYRNRRSEDGHSNKCARLSSNARRADKDAARARKEAERSEQLAGAAERRAEQADERAQAAVERFDRLRVRRTPSSACAPSSRRTRHHAEAAGRCGEGARCRDRGCGESRHPHRHDTRAAAVAGGLQPVAN